MARFEPGKGGVKVYSETGVYLGTVEPHGKRLSSAQALAQLSLREDGDGELKSLTGAARTAVLEGRA
ncbi:MAG: hypothetical protein M0R73_02570 [Dehalococcoidia bacterium]|nr:hypothetical protein [Dehalococcoidia bacterium]